MIKVYSTDVCPYCVSLKEFLKEKMIDFIEVNVSQDLKAQEELIAKSGQMGVPVMDIDGQIVVGFDRERINQLLHLK